MSPITGWVPAVSTLAPLAPIQDNHRVVEILVILVCVKHAQLVRRNRTILGVVTALAPSTVKKGQKINLLVHDQILHVPLQANVHAILGKEHTGLTLAPKADVIFPR